jgi:hypothetical protein
MRHLRLAGTPTGWPPLPGLHMQLTALCDISTKQSAGCSKPGLQPTGWAAHVAHCQAAAVALLRRLDSVVQRGGHRKRRIPCGSSA